MRSLQLLEFMDLFGDLAMPFGMFFVTAAARLALAACSYAVCQTSENTPLTRNRLGIPFLKSWVWYCLHHSTCSPRHRVFVSGFVRGLKHCGQWWTIS